MASAAIRILMVEDVATDAELEIRELKRAGLRVEHRLVDEEGAFRLGLAEFLPHVIISDFSMPRFDGMSALALARETAPEIPFIFVSGTIGEEYAIRALKNGASDYVLKTNLVRLPAAVERALEGARERRARRRAERLAASEKDLYQMIASGAPLAQVLEALCRSVESIADDGMMCSVLLLDEQGRLRTGAAPSLPESYNRRIDGQRIGPGAGSCGTAAFRGEPVIVSDIAADPLWADYRELAAAHRLGACWSVPIMSAAGKTLGTIANYYGEARAPGPADRELTERAKGLAQIAIARDHAERAIRKANRRLGLALEGSGRALFDWDVRAGTVYLSEHWAGIVGGEARPSEVGFDELSALVHPEDADRQRREIAALLKGRSDIYRTEHRVRRASGDYVWIESHGMVTARAGDGSALRVTGTNADISDEMAQRQRIARLSRIRDMLSATNSAIVRVRERQPLLDEICRIAVADGGFMLARITELGADGRARIAASTAPDEGPFQRMLDDFNRDPQRAPSLIAQVMRTGQTAVSNDVSRDERVINRAALTARGSYALALLPLVVEGRVEGAISLRAREAGVFDQDEMGLLQEIVANVAFALELMGKQARLDYLAYYDALTGLPNRTLFIDRLTQAIDMARGGGSTLSLTLFDVERFKAINDAYGQSAGDDVLRDTAARLREAVGDINRVARLGGNLFAVMRPNIRDAADAARLLQEKIAVVRAPLTIKGQEIQVAVKAGVALFPADGTNADALYRNAEAALKRAKETGERFLFYAPSINARVSEQVELEQRLRGAVERRELFLHFQPKVEIGSRRIVGLEALMRWTGPDGKLVSPARFVPLLEDTGLIFEAGQQALSFAAATYRDWRAKGLNPPRIAVNVSSLQLRSRSFVADLAVALGEPADCGVDLEITESLLMEEVDASIAKLKAMRGMGLGIALDDFGTGYSSLAYLARLPIDIIKIDRSFIHGMTANADDTTIVATIISLAQAMKYKVVAEGVETEEQARLLHLLRCDQMQGYLFSRPQPREEIEALLRASAAG